MNAIAAGDNERVSFLIEKGAKVNERDGIGHLPLQSAASQRMSEIVDILIKAGADVNARDSDGMTALLHAVNVNHVPSIELLAAKRAPTSRAGTEKGYTPLEIAMADGKFFAAKALIDCRRQDRCGQRSGAAYAAHGDSHAVATAETPEPDLGRPNAARDRPGADQAQS